jgi:hypothetical protein
MVWVDISKQLRDDWGIIFWIVEMMVMVLGKHFEITKKGITRWFLSLWKHLLIPSSCNLFSQAHPGRTIEFSRDRVALRLNKKCFALRWGRGVANLQPEFEGLFYFKLLNCSYNPFLLLVTSALIILGKLIADRDEITQCYYS